MKRQTFEKNSFVGFEFLPAEPTLNSITIYHPFASLANEHFSSKGYRITPQESGAIKISFENLNNKKKIELANEVKKFLKDSRKRVIKDFLIYKNGISYL